MNRNGKCWCGSDKKYKQCHEKFDVKYEEMKAKGYKMPDRSLVKNKKEIEGIKKSAAINTALLDELEKYIHVGMSGEEIDQIAYDFTVKRGAIPAPLGYGGFPKSLCISINEVVCHGIPSKDMILREGDIVNIDVSTIYKGYFSDASRMFTVGEVSKEARDLVQVTKECLQVGLDAVKPWGFVGDIGAAIYTYAKQRGYEVVRDFAGHGIGLEFHEDPVISHVGIAGSGDVLVPGMTFTIEPMINIGTYKVFVDADDDWTVYTEDGKLSAQVEHMILITDYGYEILSK